MAKKIDLSKLELGPKKSLKKPSQTNIEEAVRKIHEPAPTAQQPAPKLPSTEVERTRRVTLDIPVSLHKKIKARVFDMDTSMKKYFLELAKMDLKERLL
ncbi:MAG: hypothetical protein AAF990_24695 [Bacteroidota bacterium]